MDLLSNEMSYVPTTGVRRLHVTPLVEATEKALEGYGALVADPRSFPIEIVRWPAQGWRPIDENSGNQGGVTEGIFEFWWKGEILFARNNAVGDSYLFGWSNWPEEARAEAPAARASTLTSGGPTTIRTAASSSIPCMASPSSCLSPCRAMMSPRIDSPRSGATELAVSTSTRTSGMARSCRSADHAEFLDRQGRVHARVSVDFAKEFGCYLAAPLRRP